MFIQAVSAGWFVGVEGEKDGPTCPTPVEAFGMYASGFRAPMKVVDVVESKRKNFTAKPRHSLIPPHVLARHVLPVLHDGAQKHGRDHWRKCSTREYADAAMTHLQAYMDGADIDESGRHALAHAAADLLLGLGVLES